MSHHPPVPASQLPKRKNAVKARNQTKPKSPRALARLTVPKNQSQKIENNSC